ncbi:MAG TPA: hypothetical protein VMT04_04605 [Terriglobales bacterium]|nr:hypothetical protein [Terriglobales bacterium]
MKLKLIFFTTLILLSATSISFADDAAFEGEGETVWPVESRDIEMVAETVLVQPGKNGWDANCVFILRNTGEATEVQIGFPDMTDEGPGADTTKGTIQNFGCFVDGKEVVVEHRAGIPNPIDPNLRYPFAFVWSTSFERGQIRRVVNTYVFKGVLISDGSHQLIYMLRTGSLWKGKIGNAFIQFDMGKFNPKLFYSIEPPGYAIKKNKIVWKLADFEPKRNIIIFFSPYVESWLIQAEQCLQSDSTEALKRLLDESLLHWNFYIYPALNREFILKSERMIRRLKPLMDVRSYENAVKERKKSLEDPTQ